MKKKNVIVIGHKNPDTDSICSAIAYARLKNQTEGPWFEPRRTGEINRETRYVLKRFGIEVPHVCLDVSAEVQDIDIRQVEGMPGDTSMRHAWEIMRDQEAKTQPIVDDGGYLKGISTLGDLSKANMDSLEPDALAKAHTPIRNIAETLKAKVLTGETDGMISEGKIVVGAASPETMENIMEDGDIVLVGNRYETQLCAIEMGARIVIVCVGSDVARTIVSMAEQRGCILMTTEYDTYAASNLIRQSVPISAHMTTMENMLTFLPNEPVERVRQVMAGVRVRYFPVRSAAGKYLGLISRRNLLNLKKKQLILVDHNEESQAVEGIEEAEILEVVDHHRLGALETKDPVYFRNQPVGCTCTIVYQIYKEHNIQPDASIAGLMLSAILSDTLTFRSPTCTAQDRTAAEELARLADVDLQELSRNMFAAGEDLEGEHAEDIFFEDFKVFNHGEIHFGVGQGSYMSEKNMQQAMHLLQPFLEEARTREKLDMVFFMLTSVPDKSSTVLCAGDGAGELIEKAYGVRPDKGRYLLPGVVSRKKQIVPGILNTLSALQVR